MKNIYLVVIVFSSLLGTANGAVCPQVSRISRVWAEFDGSKPPAEILKKHFELSPASAAPLLLPVYAVSYWVGLSHRAPGGASPGEEPGCQVLGSAAFYYNGPEDAPLEDFVSVVRAGQESVLLERLVEFRWFDTATGKRRRWFNVKLARRLGWLTDGRGVEDEKHRPIPLPTAINVLL